MAADPSPPVSESSPLRVVGIGASAGGLEAYSRLFTSLPARTRMAYLLVPHLSPTHPSELTQLLARISPFPVSQASDGAKIQPDHLYVLPPDKVLRITGGHLRLEPRPSRDGPPTVIDACFTSLAQEWGHRAVGIVLSGSGSDGAAGLQAIKAHGGRTYAQDFFSAAYDSMPRSAVEAGGVDFTLPPEGIAHSLAQLAMSDSGEGEAGEASPSVPEIALAAAETDTDLSSSDATDLETILQLLQAGTGVDFRHYKRPSITRRVRRRLAQLGLSDFSAYVSLLANNQSELQALFNAVLIHVTEFFRDAETFEVLQSTVIPTLLSNRTGGAPIRVWVVGCASGEEAYSIAMAFLEAEATLGREMPVKIFASDLSESVLATARLGRYPDEISADVSAERLARFFVPVDGGYQVQKRLRDMCVFARQDVTRDPPFAQLDLVICRNLLIYLDPALQHRVLHVFHYALGAAGFLVLGPAETVAGLELLFSPLDRVRRVFLRRSTPSRLQLDLGWSGEQRLLPTPLSRPAGVSPSPWTSAELQQSAAQALFTQYPTGSVIVNADLEIRHFQGTTSPYLEPPSGGPTVHLLRMAHPDLRLILGRLIRKAQKDQHHARRLDIRIKVDAKVRRVNVSVIPVPTDEVEGEHFLVVFESLPGGARAGGSLERGVGLAESRPAEEETHLLQLEQELADTKEYLQAIIDQQDETHAELQAAYEASRSANEEFQSTNEELESTKEELQSVNEELNTLNEQLQQRNAELTARTAEVTGLLEAMEIPILLLTPDLRLRAFNAKAGSELRLARNSVGRPLTELQSPLPVADFLELVERTLAEQRLHEREIQDEHGNWYALRLWPVLPAGGKPSAVVAALIDIGQLRQNLDQANQARTFSEAIVESVRAPLLVLERDLRILLSNQAFRSTFAFQPHALVGQSFWEVGDGEWDLPEIRGPLVQLNRTGQGFEALEIEVHSARFGHRHLELTGRRIVPPGSAPHVLLAVEDLTERRRIEQQVISAGRMQAVGQLAGGVAHEINNQMTTVLGFADMLQHSDHLSPEELQSVVYILGAARRAADITQQLLAFGRRQSFQPVVADLNALVAASEGLLVRIVGPKIVFSIALGEGVGQVRVDQGQLEQVLVNLALNARDAMSLGGHLTIETASITVTDSTESSEMRAQVPRGTYARLIVGDTGMGMSQATAARIFEPFFTTKARGAGTGLGLASVYGTVKQSGGFIWVESEEGRGTTFTIDLPRAAAGAPEKTPETPAVAPQGSETIVVAEQEEGVRVWVSRALSELGYTVLPVPDGSDALRIITAADGAVALVLADVMMAGMGGVELRDHLAKTHPSLPVLLVSGHSLDELIGRQIVGRDDPVLQKPFDIAHLAQRIRTLLETGARPTSS